MRAIRKEQLDFLDWEFGAFFHFGIRTFYEGHKDWDGKEMPLSGFAPTELDCEQWIRTVKAAGANYAILVCKHHDGFANWPSKYTEYSVKNTPWKNGTGDVVREFTDACRKYGVKVGLYYSPAQFGSVKMEPKEYDDYFVNQISELLTDYGKIDYLWFDGCGSENHKYDEPRIIRTIRTLQPEILIFNMWDPDTRWVGNESGMVPMPNRNTVDCLNFSVQTERKDALKEKRFLPGECDCRIRLKNWFYSDRDLHTLKSTDELMGLYYFSVGRGANLLLNIGPDRRGLLPDEDTKRLLEFGERIRSLYASNREAQVERTETGYTLSFAEPTLINHLILEEEMTSGEHITSFRILIHPYSYGKPICIYQSSTVGHKHIATFPTAFTQKIEVEILSEDAPHKMKCISVYYLQ
ncbi:MAG: alpha-L-fucosidase [Clostridia bacterium]|nr:alpha-L-fucosidase [Clostridia bacterium]